MNRWLLRLNIQLQQLNEIQQVVSLRPVIYNVVEKRCENQWCFSQLQGNLHNLFKACTWSLFKPIERFMKLAHMIRELWMSKTYRFYKQFCRFQVLQKGIMGCRQVSERRANIYSLLLGMMEVMSLEYVVLVVGRVGK